MSLMRFGQRITSGFWLPPAEEATCLPYWNGVLPAMAHPAA